MFGETRIELKLTEREAEELFELCLERNEDDSEVHEKLLFKLASALKTPAVEALGA